MTNTITTSRTARFVAGIAVAAGVSVAAIGASGADNAPPRTGADTTGVAAWAQANGMGGSSPTSLRSLDAISAHAVAQSPAQQTTFVDTRGIAAWAEAEGLTGQSPASLRPIDAG